MVVMIAAARIPVSPEKKIRLTDGWSFLKSDVGNLWELVRPVRSGQPESVPLWTAVSLPHCFNAEDAVDPDCNYYQGPGWYRTLLKLDSPYPDGRIMLEFEGAGQKTEVYVGREKVATHVGGYDSWNADLTDAVRRFQSSEDAPRFKGRVPVSVRCDNSRDAEMIPSDLSDFTLYGGLYRYVNLVYLPAVSLDKLHISPVLASAHKGHVRVDGHFYQLADVREASVLVEVTDPQGKTVLSRRLEQVVPLGDVRLLEADVDKPVLWSVDAPALYTCRVTVEAGGQVFVATERFGFRSFEFRAKGPFFLNGKRLLLRGTHRHEDHAGVGAAMTYEQMEEEMRLMKQMGVNFIRLGHYQQSERILELCDELGILVWEEIPWCRGGLGGDKYKEQARRMLANMIDQHYNHPSVILWGLGNENDWPNDFPDFDKAAIRAFMKELHDLSHSKDGSRLTAIRRCDFCNDIVDVYSPSIWAGWYRGRFTDYFRYTQEEMKKVDRFLHVEWGADSHAGRHGEVTPESWEPEKYLEAWSKKKNEWSESYQVRLIDWHLKEQERMPWLTGTAYWPFKDFSTPVRPENPVPYVNQKGVVERDLTKKEAYYVFQSYWSKAPMLHIYGHGWPVRWGKAGQEHEVLVYSNCEAVELFLNGVSQGVRRRSVQNYPAAGLHWRLPFREGKNEVRAVAVGQPALADSLVFDYQTAEWGKPARLELNARNLGNGRAEVEAWLVDENGVKCLDADGFVRFGLTGEGRLVQNLGTSSGSRKVQAQNGRARIRVQLQGGVSWVSAKVSGLPAAFVQVK